MTSDGVTTFTWTHGNRMSGASRTGMTATYAYDADNRRTKKTVNGTTTRMLWSGADELGEYDGTGTLIRRFVPTGTTDAERAPVMDDRLASVDAGGTVRWFHVDHQGSVLATSNAVGQTVATANYSPYSEFGDGVSSVPTGSDFGYTGRQYDPETGLYQYRARYYSPRLGVFLSTDPVGTKDDPNLYLNVGLDPVNRTDPTGMHRLTTNSGSSGPITIHAYPGPEATQGGRVEHGPAHVHLRSGSGRGARDVRVSTETWQPFGGDRLNRAEQRFVDRLSRLDRVYIAEQQADVFRRGYVTGETNLRASQRLIAEGQREAERRASTPEARQRAERLPPEAREAWRRGAKNGSGRSD